MDAVLTGPRLKQCISRSGLRSLRVCHWICHLWVLGENLLKRSALCEAHVATRCCARWKQKTETGDSCDGERKILRLRHISGLFLNSLPFPKKSQNPFVSHYKQHANTHCKVRERRVSFSCFPCFLVLQAPSVAMLRVISFDRLTSAMA